MIPLDMRAHNIALALDVVADDLHVARDIVAEQVAMPELSLLLNTAIARASTAGDSARMLCDDADPCSPANRAHYAHLFEATPPARTPRARPVCEDGSNVIQLFPDR